MTVLFYELSSEIAHRFMFIVYVCNIIIEYELERNNIKTFLHGDHFLLLAINLSSFQTITAKRNVETTQDYLCELKQSLYMTSSYMRWFNSTVPKCGC